MTKPARRPAPKRGAAPHPIIELYGRRMPQGFRQLSSPATREYLAQTAGYVRPGHAIVELGVFTGGSIVEIARAAPYPGVPVYGIDPWDLTKPDDKRQGGRRTQYGTAVNQRLAQTAVDLLGLTKTVSLVKGYSTDIAKAWPVLGGLPIGMLYIDAHHTHDAVIEDFMAWRPHLAPGARVIFDDYWPERFPGVVTGVDLLITDGLLLDAHRAGNKLMSGRVADSDE